MAHSFEELMQIVGDFDEVLTARARDQHSVFFEVRTNEGRSQVVMAQLVQTEDEEVVHMMAEIGVADPAHYEEMLTHNLQLRYGRIAIVVTDKIKTFALVYAYPFAELDAMEFARAFGEVAFMADSIERDLYQHDKS